MKPKTLILTCVAIVCGLVASYMTEKIIEEQSRTQTVLAVVAKKDFGAGTLVKQPEEMFEKREILQRDAPKRFITVEPETLQRLRNRVLVRPMNEGDALSDYDLLSEEQEKHLQIAGVPGMIERFEELEKQDMVPKEYRQHLVALAVRTDSLERHVYLFRWVLGLVGVILFLNIIRKIQRGRFRRKSDALIAGLAVAALLGVAVLQAPPMTVAAVFGAVIIVLSFMAVMFAIVVVFLAVKALQSMLLESGSSSQRKAVFP